MKRSIHGIKRESMEMSMSELSERETNRNNVIIYNVPEATSNLPSERQAHDIKRLQNIFR